MVLDDERKTEILQSFANSCSMIVISELCSRAFLTTVSLSSRQSKFAVFFGTLLTQLVLFVATVTVGVYLMARLQVFLIVCLSTVIYLTLAARTLYTVKGMGMYASSHKYDIVHAHLDKKEKELEKQSTDVLRDQRRGKIGRHVARVFSATVSALFVAECSQRVRFVILALALRQNLMGLFFGGCLSHVLCTGIAIYADKRSIHTLSLKFISIIAGIVYLLFSLPGLYSIISVLINPSSAPAAQRQ
ncbi:putative divalent cation/proton antiporter TMEM165 [Tubulanus polymorphus]|uniref:putative divalent cation/proton antiporter TMEM165 n=1 Tax=Tubulanus polymorphus TaxID=672921 RepID=UPI003DA2A46D